MFSYFALKLEFSASLFSLSKLRYKKKINVHIQGTSKLLGYEMKSKKTPKKWKENVESQQIEKPNQKRCSKSNNKI